MKEITVPALHDELAAERAHLEASRTALRRMREHAEDLFSTGDQVAGTRSRRRRSGGI